MQWSGIIRRSYTVKCNYEGHQLCRVLLVQTNFDTEPKAK